MWYIIYLLIVVVVIIYAQARKSVARMDLREVHFERGVKGSPKVLYLRSFKLDGKGAIVNPMDVTERLNLFPPELDLAKALIKFDVHLVAVGQPGEEIPDIGFDRMYFEDAVWHQEVEKLIEESVLIIYRPDPSSALLWEFDQIVKHKGIDKLLIWADMGYQTDQNLNRTRYNIFKQKAYEQTAEELPDYDRGKIWIALDEEGYWERYTGWKFRTIPAVMRMIQGKNRQSSEENAISYDKG